MGMITINDILITEKVRKILSSKNIGLSNINYRKLYIVLKKELCYDIKLKDWNKLKQTSDYSKLMGSINELFELGYGCKFIALCLTIKYKFFISSLTIHRRLNTKRIDIAINNRIFSKSNIALKGRILYNRKAKAFYLTFKCSKIRDISQKKRIGVRIFFDKKNKKVFLERDDRAAKKITVHFRKDLYISVYPLPEKIKESLKIIDKKTYKSVPIEVNFNSDNFGYKRYELIDDRDARLLFPYLEKLDFSLERRRITNMSRSEGDLIVYKNNKKIVIEITNIGSSFKRESRVVDQLTRDRLIGKMTRICLLNNLSKNGRTIFILNNKLKKSVINEDFNNVIHHFNLDVLFTNFDKGWEKIIAEEINNLFK